MTRGKKIHQLKYGEITYRILRFIYSDEKSANKSYTQIIKFAYELTYGIDSFNKVRDRGYYSDAFVKPHMKTPFMGTEYLQPAGSLAKLLDKAEGYRGKYSLNTIGLRKLADLHAKFGRI